ncbi:MAG: tetratricopeptide repeat protein [Methylacidiphilales bacterium]|nr:tetratricopeptide repeat protein [Candidatus Methylacidiphilales bacterium]MDW8349353.1 tetratricopeptide repeat protein [Verrucomicrobiae bacterium]
MKRAPAQQPIPLQHTLAITILILITFGHNLTHHFVWDDELMTLVQNPYLNPARLENLSAFWSGAYTLATGLYTPLIYSAWLFIAILSQSIFPPSPAAPAGLHPTIFSAFSLLLHLINTLLVYKLAAHHLATPPLSPHTPQQSSNQANKLRPLLASLLFAVHPVQVETVSWISNAGTLLATLFCLLALGELIKTPAPPSLLSATYLKASLYFTLALTSKPQHVSLPLCAFGILLASQNFTIKRPQVLLLILWLSIGLVWTLITKQSQPDWLIEHFPSLHQRLWIAFDAIGFYAKHLLFPYPIIPDYGRTPPVALQSHGYAVTGLLLPILLAFIAWRIPRTRPTILLIFSASTLLLPVLGLIPFSSQNFSTVADRYLYLSMFPLALVATQGLSRLPTLTFPIAAIILTALLYTAPQVTHWKNNLTLYLHTVRHNPNSAIFLHNLAREFQKQGQNQKALPLLERAYQLKKKSRRYAPQISKSLASLYLDLGKLDAAEATLRETLTIAPDPAEIWIEIAIIYLRRRDLPQANEAYKKAITSTNQPLPIILRYFNALTQDNLNALALSLIQEAAQKLPPHPDIQNALAVAHLRNGNPTQALLHIQEAIRLAPQNPGYHHNLRLIQRALPPTPLPAQR